MLPDNVIPETLSEKSQKKWMKNFSEFKFIKDLRNKDHFDVYDRTYTISTEIWAYLPGTHRIDLDDARILIKSQGFGSTEHWLTDLNRGRGRSNIKGPGTFKYNQDTVKAVQTRYKIGARAKRKRDGDNTHIEQVKSTNQCLNTIIKSRCPSLGKIQKKKCKIHNVEVQSVLKPDNDCIKYIESFTQGQDYEWDGPKERKRREDKPLKEQVQNSDPTVTELGTLTLMSPSDFI
jgi:hypothetical protein